MSLAVFTDSTTAQASPAFILRPTAGNSTNTTSVNSCCAWSVMPTVAVSPDTRTHSCDFAYFRSAGTFELIILYRLVGTAINGFRHDFGRRAFAANLDFDFRSRRRA